MKQTETEFPDPKRIASLAMKVALDTITPEEQKELDLWVAQSEGNRETMKEMIRLCSPDYAGGYVNTTYAPGYMQKRSGKPSFTCGRQRVN